MRPLRVETMPETMTFWPVKGPATMVIDQENPLLPVMHLVAQGKPRPNVDVKTDAPFRTWSGVTAYISAHLGVRIAVSKSTPEGPRMVNMPVERYEISPGVYWYCAPVITATSNTPKLVRIAFQEQEGVYYHTRDGEVSAITKPEAKDILKTLTTGALRAL